MELESILNQGIAAARYGRKEEARQLLNAVLAQKPDSETAWLWLSRVMDTNQQRAYCLQQVLIINPQNEEARQEMAALNQAAKDALQEELKKWAEKEFGPTPEGSRIGGVRILEGAWRCVYCGEMSPGLKSHCPRCGAPKEKSEAYQLTDQAREITELAELRRAISGPNWVCSYCGAPNHAQTASCWSCGAQRAEEKPVEEPAAPPKPAEAPLKKILIGGGVFLFIILCILGAIWAFSSHEESMIVQSVHWERVVDIQEQREVERADWRDEIPSSGRILSCEQKEHHTERVKVGERKVLRTEKKDLGDGAFAEVTYEDTEPIYEEEPVYEDWCRYRIREWVAVETFKDEGDDLNPRWPSFKLQSGQRDERSEKYVVIFSSEKVKEIIYKPETGEDFMRFRPKSRWKVQVNNLGAVLDVEPL